MAGSSVNSSSEVEVERIRQSSNPYDVLGVAKDATSQEIKTAYRKLALKHHPDKQQVSTSSGDTATAKAEASKLFVKIGAAYEILSDAEARQKFDEEQRMGGRSRPRAQQSWESSTDRYDPFADFGFAGFRNFHRAAAGHGDLFSSFFADDPFFQQNVRSNSTTSSSHQGRNSFGRSPFDDPFFSSPPGFRGFGGFGSMTGHSGRGRGGMHDPFQQMEQMMQQMHGGRGMSGGGMSSFSSTTSSSGFGGASESVSTTTRIVNGRKVTQIERTLVRPDGSVERHVETKGDQDLLPPNLREQSNRQSLPVSQREMIDLTSEEQNMRSSHVSAGETRSSKKRSSRNLFGRAKRDD